MRTASVRLSLVRFLPVSLFALGAGCGATALHAGAERVLVTHQPPRDDCRFVGTIIGEQGDSFSGRFTSNRNLAEGAVNDMKNKAQDLGANYVELETTTAGSTLSGDRHGVSGQQTDVTHMGNAFVCPDRSDSSEGSAEARHVDSR